MLPGCQSTSPRFHALVVLAGHDAWVWRWVVASTGVHKTTQHRTDTGKHRQSLLTCSTLLGFLACRVHSVDAAISPSALESRVKQ